MAQNPNLRIGYLDYPDIKASLQQFMSGQAEFSDYNFEGAALSQLINLLAYNSHYDALAANMLVNEVFLDTATLRSSIVSRAKELGYIPRSSRSATTTLSISITGVANASSTSAITLPLGTRFTSTVNATQYTFVSTATATLQKQVIGGTITFAGTVQVYEGVLTQNTITYSQVAGTISIPDIDVDTSTLVVKVYTNGQWVQYNQPSNFLTITSTSNVFMLQEGFNGYEIYFGDGTLGFQPTDLSQVQMTYVVTSGAGANGALNFILVSPFTGQLSTTSIAISASNFADGGAAAESIASVKLNAPNSFGTQNRCVVTTDYETVTLQNFPQVSKVIAWNGVDNIPPLYGQICMSCQPAVGDVLLPSDKAAIKAFLAKKSVGNISVNFIDPQYLNVIVNTNVKYDSTTLSTDVYTLDANIQASIINYASTTLQQFGGIFRYSPLCSAIDDSDFSILGNQTTIQLSKYITPNLYANNNFIFSFVNPIVAGSIVSSGYYDGSSPNLLFLGDSNGIINSYYAQSGVNILYKSNLGTIDYQSGNVSISNIQMQSIDGVLFEINATPVNFDVYSSQNIILQLLQQDITSTETKDIVQ